MNEPLAICTLLLILATALVSYLGFRNSSLEQRYIFHPQSILAGKEYHRLVTSAFLHADWPHLIWNMIGLYLFGGPLEFFLGREHFLLIYFGGVIGGSLLALLVHRHHEYFAYGASGGVCGIVFAFIFLFPGRGIYLFPIPYSLPGWLYALVFLPVSFYGMKTGRGNVGHDAHLGGAIVGLLLTALLEPWAVRLNLKVFLIVLSAAILVLVYLWINPLFLPLRFFFGANAKMGRGAPSLPRRRQELQVDDVLEKIAEQGIHSLTSEERALLDEASGKYQRRAQSKKPESGLTI